MTKKFRVVRPKKYNSNGEEKTAWLPVGTYIEFENGGRLLELNDRAETYQIFPLEDKQEVKAEKVDTSGIEVDNGGDEIKTDEIPF